MIRQVTGLDAGAACPPRSTRPGLGARVAPALLWALLAAPGLIEAQSTSVPASLILPNYDRIPIGEREGIEAGAYLARTGDAGSNWYNPAGLAKSAKSAVNASATAYEWTSTELEGLGTVAGRSRISSVGTLFSAVLGKGPLHSDRWRLGFSVARPVTWDPSSIDLALVEQAGQRKLGYATDVNFDVMIPAVAVAYAPGGVSSGTFRVGAGLGMAMVSLSQTLATSDRVTTASSATVATKSFSAEGSSWDLRVSGGVQWDATPAITIGVTGAAPSLGIRGSSRLYLQDTRVAGPAMTDLVFRDPEASFRYRLPAEAAVGASVRGASGEAEINVRYFGSVATYDLYSSPGGATYTVVDNAGAVTVTTVPFGSTPNSSRSVVNVAIGGNHRLTTNTRVHAGFSTDRSPVPEGTGSIFRQVDLTRITTGVSLGGSGLTGSLGIGYSYGSGERLVTTVEGQSVDTRLKVRTTNLLFALTYSFEPK